MDTRVALLVFLLVAAVFNFTLADFNYNRITPKLEELDALGYNCIPGRTYIKIEQPTQEDDEDYEDGRRTHMNTIPSESESCKICMCSVNGRDEYCSKRPAMNVNECIRMASLIATFKRSKPFDHERSLAQRIRRDLIWHYDEVPFAPEATCVRGQTFYTNQHQDKLVHVNITWHAEVDNLLDYDTSEEAGDLGKGTDGLDGEDGAIAYTEKSITTDEFGQSGAPGKPGKGGATKKKKPCFFCVCSVHGEDMACIPRDVYFCDYYKSLRHTETGTLVGTNDMSPMNIAYKKNFKSRYQPYFRHISYRIRRTMDDGMNGYVDWGGDALCCDHPDGHRRAIHELVRSRIRNLRRRVPKENLMSKGPAEDYADFVVNNDK